MRWRSTAKHARRSSRARNRSVIRAAAAGAGAPASGSIRRLRGHRETAGRADRRRTVTVLFADIVDSSQLGAALDPEVLRVVMTRYFDTVRTIVARHGGVVEKFIGDAAMAVFGVPTLHEDDALRAVRAAVSCEAQWAISVRTWAMSTASHSSCGSASTRARFWSAIRGRAEAFARARPSTSRCGSNRRLLRGEILLGDSTYTVVGHAVEAEPAEPVELGALGRMPAYRLVALGDASPARQCVARRAFRRAGVAPGGICRRLRRAAQQGRGCGG